MKYKDMTTGNPIKLMIAFAIPLFIGNIFQQLYNVVDTMVAGYNLGDNAIAAIGASSALFGLLVGIANGMNSGFAIVISQRFGAHDEKKLRQAVAQSMKLNLFIGGTITLLTLLLLRPLLRLLNTPEVIFEEAYQYIAIISAGMLLNIAYNMFSGIYRAVGDSRTPLLFLIISSLLNVGLDILFIAGFSMSVGGAALATIISQGTSAALAGIYLYRKYAFLFPHKEDFKNDKDLISQMLTTGGSIALMYSIVDLASVATAGANNLLGEMYITARTVSGKISGIMMAPLSTIVTSVSTFVGQNYGARNAARIKEGIRDAIWMEILWGAVACGLVYLFGPGLIRFMTGTESQDIIDASMLALRWCMPFFAPLGILCVLRSSMQSMGSKVTPIITSVIELMMTVLTAFVLIPRYGFFGTAIGVPLTWSVMTIFLSICYLLQRKGLYSRIIDSSKGNG